jgi:nucleotide-binding universal stress UspA family protein
MTTHPGTPVRTIAVGVGGAGGMTAFAWAAEEAALDGSRMLLVRVSASCSPLARFTGEPPRERLERAAPLLARAVAAAGRPEVDHRVLRVVVGEPGPALAAASAHADLLVIGSGGHGNTVREVVRHARVPVVVARGVPGGRGATFADHVVVAVDSAGSGRAALDFAFAYADLHGLPVAAAHVSSPGRETLDPAAADRLRADIEPWSQKYPRTRVRRSVSRGRVTDELVRAGVGAHLLVIGDRRRGAVARARTGDVPVSVARQADCPVAVVPIERHEGTRR